jgi:hypothetical protein
VFLNHKLSFATCPFAILSPANKFNRPMATHSGNLLMAAVPAARSQFLSDLL